MKAHRRDKPTKAEVERIKAQIAAGVPKKWIMESHQLSRTTIRKLVKLG